MADFEWPTIHYTELPPGRPGSPLYAEWETYRREVGRLLAQGHEGRWILIKGEEIIGIWDTHDEALHEGNVRYFIPRGEGFMIHEIQTRERVIRGPLSPRFRICHG